jgi:hypothetical protein
VSAFGTDLHPLSDTGRGDGKKAAEEVDAAMEMKGLLKTLAKESPLTKKTVVVVDVASTTSFELSFFLLNVCELGQDMVSTMSCYAALDDQDYHVFKYARLRRSPEVVKNIDGIAMQVRFEGMPSYISMFEISTGEETKGIRH